MKRGSSHKPGSASTEYRIHGANYTLNDPTRPKRSSQAEARKAALEYDLKRRLERIVQDVMEESRAA